MSYLKKMEYGDFEEQIVIAVNNPYQLKIRPEKQIAEILGLSRSQVKNLLDAPIMKTFRKQVLHILLGRNIGITVTQLKRLKHILTIFIFPLFLPLNLKRKPVKQCVRAVFPWEMRGVEGVWKILYL